MDWNDLRYFHAVARAGSLSGAARELGVEHTTVSRRLGALEADLGAKLFARSAAGLALTPLGEELRPLVEAIAAQAEAVQRRAAGSEGRLEGTVRLTLPEANLTLARGLSELKARHPGLVVEIIADNRTLDLRRGEAEVALRFGEPGDPELVVRTVGQAGWALYASPAYLEVAGPLASPEASGAHRFIGYDASLAASEGGRWLQAHVPAAQVVMRSNSVQTAARAAAAGMGIAALPCFIGGTEEGLERASPALVGSRPILLVAHPDLVRSPRVRALLDFLAETFRRDAALWSGQA